ncbi:MAG: hypothetical protein FWD77_03560, partial [Betaproteobacteria bacterium]|nr:hypothetical protein [Betaproteobacteria bacterium]
PLACAVRAVAPVSNILRRLFPSPPHGDQSKYFKYYRAESIRKNGKKPPEEEGGEEAEFLWEKYAVILMRWGGNLLNSNDFIDDIVVTPESNSVKAAKGRQTKRMRRFSRSVKRV